MPIRDVGTRVVEFVHRQLQVDAEWCVSGPRGFTWWAGPLAQHVWADPLYEDDGIILSRVHVRTDVVRGVPDEAVAALSPVMRAATMSGLVRTDEEGGAFQLASSFFVHDQVEGGLRRVVALSAALQACEAHRLGADLARATGGRAAESAGPDGHVRRQPDDMLNVVEAVIAPQGAGPSATTGPEFAEAANWLGEQGFFANGGETGLTPAEVEVLDRVAGGTPPAGRRTVARYLLEVAKLGGYLARTKDPPPGNQVVWRGLTRLTDILLGFELNNQVVGK
jgi:hypothetical protein